MPKPYKNTEERKKISFRSSVFVGSSTDAVVFFLHLRFILLKMLTEVIFSDLFVKDIAAGIMAVSVAIRKAAEPSSLLFPKMNTILTFVAHFQKDSLAFFSIEIPYLFLLYHEAKMLARKGIFAKSSITQVCEAHIGQRPKACVARLSAYIIPQKSNLVKRKTDFG